MPQIVEATVLLRPETDQLRFLPEGPYANGDGRISWVAIQHGPVATVGSLNLFDLSNGANTTHPLPGRPGFAFPCSDGRRFIAGCEHEIGLIDLRTGSWEVLIGGVDSGVEGTIINDGLVWKDNLVFGTKDLEFATRKAGLYLYRGADQKLIRLRDDQICSNGKAIREVAGGLELIDIDSPTRKIVGYDLDISAGTLGPARTLVDLTADPAVPDGAILTPNGHSVIVSMYNPNPAAYGETRQYSLANGELEVVWRTEGSPQNTCPGFVMFEGKVFLVITTAVEHMPAERRGDSPNAGCLFAAATELDGFESPATFPLG